MADRQGDGSLTPPSASRLHPADHATPPARALDIRDTAAAPAPCAECGFPTPTLVSDGDLVSVFKCPRCGNLSAPLKST